MRAEEPRFRKSLSDAIEDANYEAALELADALVNKSDALNIEGVMQDLARAFDVNATELYERYLYAQK